MVKYSRHTAFLLSTVLVLLPKLWAHESPYPSAQQGETTWETLAPNGEEFRILMPKDPKEEAEKDPYHRMALNVYLYTSATSDGSTLMLATLSGIKSSGAYSENERFNSYVDAFGKWIPAKLPGKDVHARLSFEKEVKLRGHKGREYSLVAGDMSGPVRCFLTRKKFYALAVLGSKKNDALATRFLGSFSLPQKPAEAKQPIPPPATNAASAVGTDHSPEAATKPEDTSTGTSDPAKQSELHGGVLNGKAVSMPKPESPPEARDITGTVTVQVTIDEEGNVTAARAIAGPEPLRAAAEAAAMQAKFSPTKLSGKPVKLTGVITYNFGVQ